MFWTRKYRLRASFLDCCRHHFIYEALVMNPPLSVSILPKKALTRINKLINNKNNTKGTETGQPKLKA